MKLSERNDMTAVRSDTVSEGGSTYRYTLFIRRDPHATYRSPLYSVRAEVLGGDCYEALDAFIDPGHALIFYELLRTHRVSPVHLLEVLEDFEH